VSTPLPRPTTEPCSPVLLPLPLSAWEDRYYVAQAILDPVLRARAFAALAEAMIARIRELRP
jgi:hypothetical protein